MPERIYDNPVIAKIRAFHDSILFPVAVGALVLLLCLFRIYLVATLALIVVGMFPLLFCKNLRALVPVIMMFPLTLSIKNETLGMVNYLSPLNLTLLIVFGLMMLGGLVFNLVAYRKERNYKEVFGSRLFVSTVCLALILLLGGMFSKWFSWVAFAARIGDGACLLLPFVLFCITMEKREDNLRYLAFCASVAAAVVTVQVLQLYVVCFPKGGNLDSEWKDVLMTNWGISNGVGMMLSMLTPAVFYLIYNEKRGALYYLLLVPVVLATIFTLCRSAYVTTICALIVCTVICLIKSKNRKSIAIITASVVTLGIAVLIVLLILPQFDYLFTFFKQVQFNDRRRMHLWTEWLKLFPEEPIFGVGFVAYKKKFEVDFSYNAHNTLIQMVVGCGLMGAVIYGYHRIETYLIMFKKPTPERTLISGMIIVSIVGSLLATFFFAEYAEIYYSIIFAFLKLAEPPEKPKMPIEKKQD